MSDISRDATHEKSVGGWKKYSVNDRNRWLFGILTIASFLTLQTLLAVGLQDIALTISLITLAVVLPMNVLLVLLTYATRQMPGRVRFFFLSSPAVIGTIIGIDSVFWHASRVGGVVFTVVSVIGLSVALYYLRPEENAKEKRLNV